MPREPLQNQINESVAHLVDEYRQSQEIQDAVDDCEGEIKELKEQMDDLKTVLRDRRETLKESQDRCLALINELAMLSDGKPRLPNITPTIATDSKDPADAHGVSELMRFGLTEKQIEKLKDSQLAEECSVKSVGDLIKAISSDIWWHKKVKGWGESAIEKATDALVRYREHHPEPDGDDRPKKCRSCEHIYPAAESRCPECKSLTWELVDTDKDSPSQQELEFSDESQSEAESGDATDPQVIEMPEDVPEEELHPVES